MGRPYSLDLRERVVAALEDGMSTRQAAARFSVSISAVGEWGRLKRAQGDVRPAKQGKPPGSVLDAHRAFILEALDAKPDTTLEEMVARLAAERDVHVVWTTVWKFLDRHGQTHKKRPPTPANSSAPTSRSPANDGRTSNPSSTRSASSSSTKAGCRPRWRAYGAGRPEASAAVPPFRTGTGRP